MAFMVLPFCESMFHFHLSESESIAMLSEYEWIQFRWFAEKRENESKLKT